MKPLAQVLARRDERDGEVVVKEILTRFDVRTGSTISIRSRVSTLRELNCSSVRVGAVASSGIEERSLNNEAIQVIARSRIWATLNDACSVRIGWPLALSVSITRLARLRLCSSFCWVPMNSGPEFSCPEDPISWKERI